MTPSITDSMNCEVRLRWISWIDAKRETMSPRLRFSKNGRGSVIMWPNALPSHWKFRLVLKATTNQVRTAPSTPCSRISRPKPSASTPSRSRSEPTIAWSTVHCR